MDFGRARVGGEVVNGDRRGFAAGEGAEVLDEQFCFERVRVIEVDLCALVRGQVGEAAVISIVGNARCAVVAEAVEEHAGERGFARARAAGNGDDVGLARGVGHVYYPSEAAKYSVN